MQDTVKLKETSIGSFRNHPDGATLDTEVGEGGGVEVRKKRLS